jgi:hypothetical protein
MVTGTVDGAGTPILSNYWRLGDSTSTLTDSKGDASGTYQSGTNQVLPSFGQFGALQPDDPNSAVSFSSSQWASTVSRSLAANFSAELWFKSTSMVGPSACVWDSVPSMLRTTAFGPNKFEFGISLCNGRVVAGTTDSKATASLNASTVGSDNSWHHVVFTRSNTGPITLYLDGALAGSNSSGPTRDDPEKSNFFIAGIATTTNNFVGTLDEIAVYSGVLTLSQVQSHFYAGR